MREWIATCKTDRKFAKTTTTLKMFEYHKLDRSTNVEEPLFLLSVNSIVLTWRRARTSSKFTSLEMLPVTNGIFHLVFSPHSSLPCHFLKTYRINGGNSNRKKLQRIFIGF